MMDPELHQAIFQIKDQRTFRETALKVFLFQSVHNPVYREYITTLQINPSQVREVEEIPFLPIEFFRTHRVLCEGKGAELVFESSGTTGRSRSKHHVADTALYRESFTRGFQFFYGSPEQYCILALLPSYLERSGSSLVYMMDHLIRKSEHPDSGFYLDDFDKLFSTLETHHKDRHPTLLVGVSFALLDLAEKHPIELGTHMTVMETGGMKGRRKELIRNELHSKLKKAFGCGNIHSEYGMTELLSQAYAMREGRFRCPPWMKILIRDPNDPFSLLTAGHSGGINIIDLANLFSCSFIATADLGKAFEDESFEVLGRFDHSDTRGCNLLVS